MAPPPTTLIAQPVPSQKKSPSVGGAASADRVPWSAGRGGSGRRPWWGRAASGAGGGDASNRDPEVTRCGDAASDVGPPGRSGRDPERGEVGELTRPSSSHPASPDGKTGRDVGPRSPAARPGSERAPSRHRPAGWSRFPSAEALPSAPGRCRLPAARRASAPGGAAAVVVGLAAQAGVEEGVEPDPERRRPEGDHRVHLVDEQREAGRTPTGGPSRPTGSGRCGGGRGPAGAAGGGCGPCPGCGTRCPGRSAG